MADFMSAMGILLTPYCLIMMVIGGFIGLILGAIPGLSGAMAITIILPLTFAMDSNVAIAMLIAIWVGSCSDCKEYCSGSIPQRVCFREMGGFRCGYV